MLDQGHVSLIAALISADEAKMTDARSPCMPAPRTTGLPGAGPLGLESVLNRKLNSQTLLTFPSTVLIVYVSPQCCIDLTCPSGGALLRFGFLPPPIIPPGLPLAAGALTSDTARRYAITSWRA